MNWNELKDKQRIKALDKIFFVEDGSIVHNDDGDVYITETQITSGRGLTIAAMKDDIGIWNEETKTLDFSRINSDGKKFVMYLDFEDDYRNGFIIDNEIFEVLNEFGEL